MEYHCDHLIIGGGIMGLWLASLLKQQGSSVLLVEQEALGNGQTVVSQGIIHAGVKYQLGNKKDQLQQEVALAASLWRKCFLGQGIFDLSSVPLLSSVYYLWQLPQVGLGAIKKAILSRALKSVSKLVAPEAYPKALSYAKKQGFVLEVAEQVVDVSALLAHFASYLGSNALLGVPQNFDQDKNGHITAVTIAHGDKGMKIIPRHVYFTAGAGNAALLEQLKPGSNSALMQRRPLQMVYYTFTKEETAEPLFMHALKGGTTPLFTITSHVNAKQELVWYIGGAVAEDPASRSSQAQIAYVMDQMQSHFPDIGWKKAQFRCFFIDRAEDAQPKGRRPLRAFNQVHANYNIIWPSKLTLAPLVAKSIVNHVKQSKEADIAPCDVQDWPSPPCALAPWDGD